MLDLHDFKIKASYAERILSFEKLANRKVDIHICTPKSRTSAIFSSEDLNNCMSNTRKSTFICKQREIKLYHNNPNDCKSNILPKVLAFELSRQKYIVEKNAGETRMVCNSTVYKIFHINSTAIIDLPPNCHLENLNFFIDIERNQETANSTINEILPLVKNIDPNEFNHPFMSNLTELNSRLLNVNKQQAHNQNKLSNFSADFSAKLENVKKAHEQTKLDLDKANQNKAPEVHMGLSIGMIISVFIGLVILLILCKLNACAQAIPINEH